nr:putative LAGLIDADG homing endonuclease [Oedogonium sp. HN1801B]
MIKFEKSWDNEMAIKLSKKAIPKNSTKPKKKIQYQKRYKNLQEYKYIDMKKRLNPSETLCETTLEKIDCLDFDFKTYLNTSVPQHISTLSLAFLEWLIGFTEGDGCFSSKIQRGRPRLVFEIAQKDPKILYKIRKNLGFGRIFKENRLDTENPDLIKNYWKFSVGDKKGIQKLFILFNGNLILPKRQKQFQRWCEQAQEANLLPSEFSLKTNSPKVSLNTGWLSGLIEAEGCFYTDLRLPKIGVRENAWLSKVFEISQKDEEGEKQVLEEIGRLLESKAKVRGDNRDDQMWRLSVGSMYSHKILVNYLDRFPLQGEKFIVYRNWWRVHLAILQKAHLDPIRLPKVIHLCQSINNKNKKKQLVE